MPWWGWIVIGTILFCAELFAVDAQFYFIFVGAGALVVGLTGLSGLDLPAWGQWLLFAMLSIASMVAFRKKLFDKIRTLFSQTQEAKARGYKPGRFSFNVSGGRCEACKGDGTIKIEMHFLPDVYVPCEVCAGRRYNRETLEILWKGHNIADVLEMSVEEALGFFEHQPKIVRVLQTLFDVGLGYVRLGQPAPTLSGGEAQRIKLASELGKRSTGRTFYILDEPTTGLHFEDIRKLLQVLHRLVDSGNTVVVIEHNLDVVKSVDHVIDLGPEGGSGGGRIIAIGTPEEIAQVGESYTGKFLREMVGS